MIQNPRRNELTQWPFLRNALDLILANWARLFGVEHDAAGHHADVTADSLTVSGSVTVEQDINVFTGTVTANSVVATTLSATDVTISDDLTVNDDLTVSGLTSSVEGYKERNRSVAMGEWQAVSFSAGNFTASASMTWTVASGDVSTNRYTLVGNTLTWSLGLSTTTVGGTPGLELRATVPGGFTLAGYTICALAVCADNGVQAVGFAEAASGNTYVGIKLNFGGTNWTASADATAVFFTLTCEVA